MSPSGTPSPSNFDSVNSAVAAELNDIHKQMELGEINVPDMIARYNKKFPGEGVLRFAQDLDRLSFVYKNMLEEIKRINPRDFFGKTKMPGENMKESFAEQIRDKYLALGLIPKIYLPETMPWELVSNCLDKLRKIWNGQLLIFTGYKQELLAAMRLEPGTTVTFQVGLGLDGPGATIGWERTFE